MSDNVRLRVAPSPTGDPHIGTLRTALFNYLYAKKNSGKFIFRLEDTDKAREVPGSIAKIEESFSWVGVVPDEGPSEGGEAGPYVQSERLGLYKEFAERLVAVGKAYRCFCSQERLTILKDVQTNQKLPPRYDRLCRYLSQAEIDEKIKKNNSYTIRMTIPDGELVEWNDLIKGKIVFKSDDIDDQVLLKSDGFPTYHLASVVDDHLMRISHVLRGEDWLSSTPKHLLLYQSFGWKAPLFGHLPLIINSDRSKLSKRHNNTSVLYYKIEKGYHPMAMIHFMAFLGWSPERTQESYCLEDLIRDFSLERVGVSPAIFDIDRLNFLGKKYLAEDAPDQILALYLEWLSDPRHSLALSEKRFIALDKKEHSAGTLMIDICRRRSSHFSELSEQLAAFFIDSNLVIKEGDLTMDGKIEKDVAKQSLVLAREVITDIQPDNIPVKIDERISFFSDYFKQHQPAGMSGQVYLHPPRVALTLRRQSMNTFEFLSGILMVSGGKEEMIGRLNRAISVLER